MDLGRKSMRDRVILKNLGSKTTKILQKKIEKWETASNIQSNWLFGSKNKEEMDFVKTQLSKDITITRGYLKNTKAGRLDIQLKREQKT